jgi:Amiloride-sensitive sodium channel
MTSERSEIYGVTGFLANCGGLLGLCLGVSVISLFEIVYFCAIRLCFNLHSKKSIDHTNTKLVDQLPNLRTKTSRFGLILKNLAVDYSRNTTIHGIIYITDDKLSVIERVWWAIVVFISISCCGSLILDVFRRYEQSPVIISYASEETLATQIPFPAVTVCPQFVTEHLKDIYYNLKVLNVSLYDYGQSE